MKRRWGSARLDAFLKTDHGKAFTKCGGVVSGRGSQMAICVRKVKDMTRDLRDLGYSTNEINTMVEKRVLDEFVVKRRDLMLRRANTLQKKAEQLRNLAFTIRVRKSRAQSAPPNRRLRFGFSVK
jgi:hypothetical protein